MLFSCICNSSFLASIPCGFSFVSMLWFAFFHSLLHFYYSHANYFDLNNLVGEICHTTVWSYVLPLLSIIWRTHRRWVWFIILFSLPEFWGKISCDSAVVRWESLEDQGPGFDSRTRLFGLDPSKKVYIYSFCSRFKF